MREEALGLLRASGAILPQRELTRMVNEVSDEVVGFGPIEFLLKDPDVTEVMVNGPDDVYVERVGRLERAPDGRVVWQQKWQQAPGSPRARREVPGRSARPTGFDPAISALTGR